MLVLSLPGMTLYRKAARAPRGMSNQEPPRSSL
jgi:hypothetical protein